MLCHSSALWEAAPTELPERLVSVVSVVICFASLIVLPSSLVMKDPMEVCPLSREGMLLLSAHPLSVPLQSGVRFFPSSCTRISMRTSCEAPTLSGDIRAYHVLHTCLGGLGPASFAGGGCGLRQGRIQPLYPSTLPFGSSLSAPLTCSS